MRLTVVGSSGSVPGPDSACPCYLVEQDGFRLLLDMGTGAIGPLQLYVAPADVDAVVVTHAHGDHWAGLVDLGYLRTLPDVGPLPPLPVHGPANLRTPCEALDELAAGCEVLLAEASGVLGPLRGGHLTSADAGRLAARSGARLLILTQLRPWQDHAELLAEAARHASCPVVLATPGLSLETARPAR